jgi:uncharacterized protein
MTNWVIKLSKLCNLRCGYCYEWNELHNPNKMSLDLVEKISSAAEQFHRIQAGSAPSAHTTIIIHGGEPFVLPPEYLRAVFGLVRSRLADLSHSIALQSNMYRVSDRHLDLCKEYRVRIGVSYDLISGVRLTPSGHDTEDRVDKNTRRAQKAGFNPGAVVVLAKHTAPHLREIYDFFVARGMPFRVLPLSDGPSERPQDLFALSLQDAISAMCDLFDYWICGGRQIEVEPFKTYFRDALSHMLDVSVEKYDRLARGDYALFVDVDGLLYAERDAYDKTLALGNLNTQSISDILRSEAYKSSVRRETALTSERCASCELNDSCSGLHIIATKARGAFDDPCSIAPAVIRHITARLLEWGYGSDTIRAMLPDGNNREVERAVNL